MRQYAFQVRLNVIKPGFKAFVVSGLVLATTQVVAVEEAKKTLKATLDEQDKHNNAEIKLLSASPLKNDFFLIAKEEAEEVHRDGGTSLQTLNQ